MKGETRNLLTQCRMALLKQNDERLVALLTCWFENMIGDEDMDEQLDDLCLLLGFRVQSVGAETSYATYTSWWEVEGRPGESEGTFFCAQSASLRQRLLTLPIKQFPLVIELAFQWLSILAEGENAPPLPTGQPLLRAMIPWLARVEPDSSYEDWIRQREDGNKKQQRRSEQKQAASAASLPRWKRELARWQEQKPLPEIPLLPAEVVLPASWEDLLTREQIAAFLTLLQLPASQHDIKAGLVLRLQERLAADPQTRARFFELFCTELAVPPWELETLLSCTTPERKRWTEQGKLPVLEQRSFRKGSNQHKYPVFDRRIILTLTQPEIKEWRAEHQAALRERQRTAAARRKARQADHPLPQPGTIEPGTPLARS